MFGSDKSAALAMVLLSELLMHCCPSSVCTKMSKVSQTDWRPAQLSKIKLAVGRMAERIHQEQVSDET